VTDIDMDAIRERAAEAYWRAGEDQMGFTDQTWGDLLEESREQYRWAVDQITPIVTAELINERDTYGAVVARLAVITGDSSLSPAQKSAQARALSLGGGMTVAAEVIRADLAHVTRICVVDSEHGRAFERYNFYLNGVELHLQDDGRTLKILPRKEEADN
jgi:hypothetical protein